MSSQTPQQLLQAIVEGINTGNLEALISLYEPEAAFAAQPMGYRSRRNHEDRNVAVRSQSVAPRTVLPVLSASKVGLQPVNHDNAPDHLQQINRTPGGRQR
jgi:hypothetical protein